MRTDTLSAVGSGVGYVVGWGVCVCVGGGGGGGTGNSDKIVLTSF